MRGADDGQQAMGKGGWDGMRGADDGHQAMGKGGWDGMRGADDGHQAMGKGGWNGMRDADDGQQSMGSGPFSEDMLHAKIQNAPGASLHGPRPPRLQPPASSQKIALNRTEYDGDHAPPPPPIPADGSNPYKRSLQETHARDPAAVSESLLQAAKRLRGNAAPPTPEISFKEKYMNQATQYVSEALSFVRFKHAQAHKEFVEHVAQKVLDKEQKTASSKRRSPVFVQDMVRKYATGYVAKVMKDPAGMVKFKIMSVSA